MENTKNIHIHPLSKIELFMKGARFYTTIEKNINARKNIYWFNCLSKFPLSTSQRSILRSKCLYKFIAMEPHASENLRIIFPTVCFFYLYFHLRQELYIVLDYHELIWNISSLIVICWQKTLHKNVNSMEFLSLFD